MCRWCLGSPHNQNCNGGACHIKHIQKHSGWKVVLRGGKGLAEHSSRYDSLLNQAFMYLPHFLSKTIIPHDVLYNDLLRKYHTERLEFDNKHQPKGKAPVTAYFLQVAHHQYVLTILPTYLSDQKWQDHPPKHGQGVLASHA